ncbi:MAG: HAD family hydrolase [bacterium]|nr:HAD family hydrolase [bacterium]
MADKIRVYDLDGTLSSLNNTFDFVRRYHTTRGAHFRLFLLRAFASFFFRFRVSPWLSRRILIMLAFFGVREDALSVFFEHSYIHEFSQTLTPLGREVKASNNEHNVLLTGCVCTSARPISEWFGFGLVICTEPRTIRGRIVGVRKDTYGNRKKDAIRDLFQARGMRTKDAVYYTDDPKTEKDVTPLFGSVIDCS